MIVRLLTQVLLRGLATGNDRLQEDRLLILHERHQVDVGVAPHHEDPLLGVSLRVRVRQDVEQVSVIDQEHFAGMPAERNQATWMYLVRDGLIRRAWARDGKPTPAP